MSRLNSLLIQGGQQRSARANEQIIGMLRRAAERKKQEAAQKKAEEEAGKGFTGGGPIVDALAVAGATLLTAGAAGALAPAAAAAPAAATAAATGTAASGTAAAGGAAGTALTAAPTAATTAAGATPASTLAATGLTPAAEVAGLGSTGTAGLGGVTSSAAPSTASAVPTAASTGYVPTASEVALANVSDASIVGQAAAPVAAPTAGGATGKALAESGAQNVAGKVEAAKSTSAASQTPPAEAAVAESGKGRYFGGATSRGGAFKEGIKAGLPYAIAQFIPGGVAGLQAVNSIQDRQIGQDRFDARIGLQQQGVDLNRQRLEQSADQFETREQRFQTQEENRQAQAEEAARISTEHLGERKRAGDLDQSRFEETQRRNRFNEAKTIAGGVGDVVNNAVSEVGQTVRQFGSDLFGGGSIKRRQAGANLTKTELGIQRTQQIIDQTTEKMNNPESNPGAMYARALTDQFAVVDQINNQTVDPKTGGTGALSPDGRAILDFFMQNNKAPDDIKAEMLRKIYKKYKYVPVLNIGNTDTLYTDD